MFFILVARASDICDPHSSWNAVAGGGMSRCNGHDAASFLAVPLPLEARLAILFHASFSAIVPPPRPVFGLR